MGQYGGVAGSLVGAVIGTAIAPGIGTTIGAMAGGLIGSLIFNRAQKPLISDVQLGNSSYGNVIPRVYGTVRLTGQMIWQSKVKTSSSSFGKGASTASYHYHQSAAWLFCEGPARLVKIWLDGRLFWDGTARAPHELTRHTFAMREHAGDEDQMPDPLIADWVRDNVVAGYAAPAYRGVATLVFEGVDLINYGNRLPQVTATWTTTDVSPGALVTPLVRFSPDASSFTSPSGFYASFVAVDWVRGTAYWLSQDGTVRAFSTATGQQTAEIAKADYRPISDDPTRSSNYSGICVGQGGKSLYAWGAINDGQSWILELDPVTLRPNPAGGITVTGAVYGMIEDMQVIQVPTTEGRFECVLGYFLFGHQVFLVPAPLGPIPFQSTINIPVGGGLQNEISLIIGQEDIVTQKTAFYILTSASIDVTGSIYVFRAHTDANALVPDLTLIYTLTPANFGQAPAGVNAAGWYDPADDTLIIAASGFSGNNVVKFSPALALADKDPILWAIALPEAALAVAAGIKSTPLGTQTMGFRSANAPNTWNLLDTASGAVSAQVNVPGSTPGAGLIYAWDGATQSGLFFRQAFPTFELAVVSFHHIDPGLYPVAQIIRDLCHSVGMTDDMLDVSQVTASTAGYVVRDMRSAGQALLDICQIFQLDMVESDYALRFIPRGKDPVATIPQAKLSSIDPADMGRFWEEKPAQEQDMPLQINLKYSDPDLDYQPGAAYARRIALPIPTTHSKRRQVVDLPVVMNNQQARSLAETWLYTLWAERETYQTMLSKEFLYLDPTDNVTITFDNGDSITARIEQIETGADLALHVALASEDKSAYLPSSAAVPTVYPTLPQTPTPQPFITLLQFNVPLLQDADATDGTRTRVYYAAAATGGGFTTATVYHSTDNLTWNATSVLGAAADWGTALTALGRPVTKFATDIKNTLRVSFQPGSTLPSSIATIDLMNGGNALLVGKEIIQFQTVTDNSDGSVTLSGLLRGRRGTEWATDSHAAGELVVMLVAGQVSATGLTLAEINQSEGWKIAASSTALSAVQANNFIYRGWDLMPYAPVGIVGLYSGSDIALSWVRRTRIGGLLVDGSDLAPLGETTEAYSVDILSGPGGTVKRTLAGLTSPAATYAAANIATDFPGGAPTLLTVRVYQLSSVVGRGFSSDTTLDLAAGLEVTEVGDAPPVAVTA